MSGRVVAVDGVESDPGGVRPLRSFMKISATLL